MNCNICPYNNIIRCGVPFCVLPFCFYRRKDVEKMRAIKLAARVKESYEHKQKDVDTHSAGDPNRV